MERRSLIRAGRRGRRRRRAAAAPALAQGAAARTLRVVPQANLTSLDPVWTTAVVTRNHAFLIYDQLCAQDSQGEIRPQMAEGWATENDGRDTRPSPCAPACSSTTASRCGPGIASPPSGAGRRATPSRQVLWDRVEAVEALDDRRFRFRLKRRIPLLLLALGQTQFPCFIMPERIAATDPFQQIARSDRLRPLPLPARRVEPGPARGLGAERGLRAAPGAGGRPGRRAGAEDRARRVDDHHRPGHGGRTPW